MNQEQINAWTPTYRHAIESVLNEDANITYVTKDELNLKETADIGPWEGSESIKLNIPYFDKLIVELITLDSNLNRVHEELRASKDVGLVLLGATVSRNSKPSLIVLTTDDKLYAIDPNDKARGIKFLQAQLHDPNVTFWTTDGLHEADSLKHNYDITLYKSGARDCVGLHMHMMLFMKHLPDTALRQYPPRACRRARAPVKLEDFETLAEIWLDIDRRDIFYGANQLPHLNTRPLDITATNIIKKRCALVKPLVESLKLFANIELRIMNLNTLERFRSATRSVRDITSNEMKRLEEKGEIDPGFLVHMQGGTVIRDIGFEH